MREIRAEDFVIGSELASGGIAFEAPRRRALVRVVAERLEWLDGPSYGPFDEGPIRARGRRLVREADRRGREMLEMYYMEGYSFSEIGRRLGISDKTAAKRVRRLTAGLMGEEYVTCMNLQGPLSWFHRELARERYVLGLGRREIARRHGRPLSTIDRHLRYIERQIRSRRREHLKQDPPSPRLRETGRRG